jgi:hypothetical protein
MVFGHIWPLSLVKFPVLPPPEYPPYETAKCPALFMLLQNIKSNLEHRFAVLTWFFPKWPLSLQFNAFKSDYSDRHKIWLCHGSCGQSPACHRGGPSLIPGHSMWDLWWRKWHWDRFFPECFGFPLSVSFQPCSITREKNHLNQPHHRVAK